MGAPDRIMAIDQYGQIEHGLPVKGVRKALMERLGVKSARKIYTDRKGTYGRPVGDPIHSGYIVAGRWFTLYLVSSWEGGK